MDELRTDLAIAVVGAIAASIVVAAVFAILSRLTPGGSRLLGLVSRTHRPVQLLTLSIVTRALVPSILPIEWRGRVAQTLTVAVVLGSAWLVGAVVLSLEEIAATRFPTNVADNLAARRFQTQLTVIKRVTVVVICVFAVGAVLTTFPAARAAGAGLLASAGLAGVVAALAAQSTLGNVFAGLHIAFGNSLRLDDVVVVENEWGRVEEITLSYVVVRIWDDRRLILPTSYFMTTPFQNWTRSSASVLGTVEVDVDWTVPLETMRAEGRRTVEDSPLWDRRAYGLQVTDTTGGRVRVRLLVSAADSSALWDLRCLLRERMVIWIQQRHPRAVPRVRAELDGSATRAALERRATSGEVSAGQVELSRELRPDRDSAGSTASGPA